MASVFTNLRDCNHVYKKFCKPKNRNYLGIICIFQWSLFANWIIMKSSKTLACPSLLNYLRRVGNPIPYGLTQRFYFCLIYQSSSEEFFAFFLKVTIVIYQQLCNNISVKLDSLANILRSILRLLWSILYKYAIFFASLYLVTLFYGKIANNNFISILD